MSKVKKGFTLLELILVIFIISVILGVSFPLIKNSINSYRVRSFVNKAYLFLDYAQTKATLSNKKLKVSIDLDEKLILLSDEASRLAIPDDISLQTEQEEIVFYPDGTSDEFELVINEVTLSSRGFDCKIQVE